MSASERLRELGAAARPQVDQVVAEQEAKLTRRVREKTGDPTLTVEAGSPMLSIARALPEIVAVVEAAEQQAELVKDEEIEWRWPGLEEALAALEEKLGQDKP